MTLENEWPTHCGGKFICGANTMCKLNTTSNLEECHCKDGFIGNPENREAGCQPGNIIFLFIL